MPFLNPIPHWHTSDDEQGVDIKIPIAASAARQKLSTIKTSVYQHSNSHKSSDHKTSSLLIISFRCILIYISQCQLSCLARHREECHMTPSEIRISDKQNIVKHEKWCLKIKLGRLNVLSLSLLSGGMEKQIIKIYSKIFRRELLRASIWPSACVTIPFEPCLLSPHDRISFAYRFWILINFLHWIFPRLISDRLSSAVLMFNEMWN